MYFGYERYSFTLVAVYFLLYLALFLGELYGFIPLFHFEGQYILPVQVKDRIYFNSLILGFLGFIFLFFFSYLSEHSVKMLNLEKQRSRALQDGTLYLTQAIGNREEILQRLLRAAIEVTEADSASLVEFRDDLWRFIVWENIDDKIIEKIAEEFRINPLWNLKMVKSSGKILYFPDTNKISYWIKGAPVRSYIGCPVVVKGEVIAVLNIDSKKPNRFSSTDLQIVESLGRIVTNVMEKHLFLEEESYLRKLAEEASVSDYLTGLYNRRELTRVLKQEISRCLRYEDKFQVIVFDLDNFKRVNDTYGHVEGDRFLVEFSSILRESNRKSDFIFRYGGDEFILLLVNSGPPSVDVVIERVETAFHQIFAEFVEKLKIDFSYGSVSFPDDLEGVIKGGAFKGDFVDTLYNLIFVKIDEFLYTNKKSKGSI